MDLKINKYFFQFLTKIGTQKKCTLSRDKRALGKQEANHMTNVYNLSTNRTLLLLFTLTICTWIN